MYKPGLAFSFKNSTLFRPVYLSNFHHMNGTTCIAHVVNPIHTSCFDLKMYVIENAVLTLFYEYVCGRTETRGECVTHEFRTVYC